MSGFLILKFLAILVFAISILLAYTNLWEPTFYQKNLNSIQNEINLDENTNVTEVLTEQGQLSYVGWSKNYKLFTFNSSRIKASTSLLPLLDQLRYKKWESIILTHPDFIIGIKVFDLSYLGGYMVHYADLTVNNTEIISHEFLNPVTKPEIFDNCISNCIVSKFIRPDFNFFQARNIFLGNQYINMTYKSEKEKDFNIKIDIDIRGKDLDSMVSLTPISNDTSLFYYNIKSYCLLPKGSITINDKKLNTSEFNIVYNSARGVWPLRSGWFWVSGSGVTDNDHKIGLNFGHGFSHPLVSRHTEDCFFINGEIFKLNSVKFREDNGTWEFISEGSNNCQVKFTQIKKSDLSRNFIITKRSFNIYYGIFNGKCQDYKNNNYTFNSVYGILEDKLSFW